MALFNPRTFPVIMGDMIARIVATTPITDMNYGSVITTMLEASAQEDDEQYFQMLEIIRGYSIDTVTGSDLDARAAEYGLTRLTAQFASTTVTLGDSAITKVTTNVYPGLPGASAGSLTINGVSSAGFPSTGAIIIGRGFPDVETVNYTSITSFSNFVTFNLSSLTPLASDHGTDETIILSQGGIRTFSSGLVVDVPASDISTEIDFTLSASAHILDGEQFVIGVPVVASVAGSASNVPVGAIIAFDSPPFSTATVTNTMSVTNGSDIETDQALRDRIKNTIQSLSRGTATSIITNTIGLISSNLRVVSASIVEPTVPADVVKLYIDDGVGFVPTFNSVGFQTVISNASGGEKFLSAGNPTNLPLNLPFVKAFVESGTSQPFGLTNNTLYVSVGGAVETINFSSANFATSGAATAQEVIDVINSLSGLVEARLTNGGQNVKIFARANVNEQIQVTGGSANSFLNFPTNVVYTSNLYLTRDNVTTLLSKDGVTASVESGSAGTFNFSANNTYLSLIIDGKIGVNNTNIQRVVFSSTANVNFAVPSQALVSEVVTAINQQIVGATAFASSDGTKVTIASNTKNSAASAIQVNVPSFTGKVTSGSPTVTNVFTSSFGFPNVYLGMALTASSDVTAGTYITAINAAGNSFTMSANATGGSATTVTFSHYHDANSILNFSSNEVVGANNDYQFNRFIGQIEMTTPLLAGDTLTLGSPNTRASVLSEAGNFNLAGSLTLEIQISTYLSASESIYSDQTVTFSSNSNTTAASVVTQINAQTHGVTASVVNGNQVLITTNEWSEGSTLQIISGGSTANSGAGLLNFPTTVSTSTFPQYASVESNPIFYNGTTASGTNTTTIVDAGLTAMFPTNASLGVGFEIVITSGSYAGETANVVSYVASTGTITVATFGNAPGIGVTYQVQHLNALLFNANDYITFIIDGNQLNNLQTPCYFSGTATTGTTTTIIDANLSKYFTTNGSLNNNFQVLITGGTYAGERATISSYNAGTNTITTSAFSNAPGAVTYQILPITTIGLVQLWNNTNITLLSNVASIELIQGQYTVQVSSLTEGQSGSVQVAGGPGNLSNMNFPTSIVYGIDAYKYYTGLLQLVQWTVDGVTGDTATYPGFRAAGVQVEVIDPITFPVSVILSVSTVNGVTLGSLTNDIKSAVSTYINNLPIGGDVLVSQIIEAVLGISGVTDCTVISPASNIAVTDAQQPSISESDISVG